MDNAPFEMVHANIVPVQFIQILKILSFKGELSISASVQFPLSRFNLSMKNTHIIAPFMFLTFVMQISIFQLFPLITSDEIFLNCGSSGASQFNGDKWVGDIDSDFLPPSSHTISSTLFISNSDSSVPTIPYSTARIIHSSFTYSFPLAPGLKLIRFYVVSTSYLGVNPSAACFSVKTGRYTLLDNFSPADFAEEVKSVYFTKDFLVNVKEERLNITFNPSSLVSKAVAFVNGIEIFSDPQNIYFNGGGKFHLPFIDGQRPFLLNDEYAFEMLYRVNVGYHGGAPDAVNVFGRWMDDYSYIFGSESGSVIDITRSPETITIINCSSTRGYPYVAPEELYWNARTMGSDEDTNARYNLTWSFSVDSGFKYLIRLHFAEIAMEITQANQRVFNVYINNQTAEEGMDLIALTGKPFVGFYRDYVVMVSMEKGTKNDIWIAIHPNMKSKPKFANAILSGIEILKLSDNSHNLAARTQFKRGPEKKKRALRIIFGGISGFLLALIAVCLIIVHRGWKSTKWGIFCMLPLNHSAKSHKNMQLRVALDQCHQFTFAEITTATNNFSEDLVIGKGGFGKVYKGFIRDGETIVAIKRCNPKSHQGVREFQNEINLLSFFRHTNLVSLLGYCQEDKELILVYEYMAHGTLSDHLYKRQNEPLPWNQRLKICIGTARGLHYLHTGTRHPVIHRDIKSANILLDQNMEAKIADFGLSRIGPTSASQNHVSTEVKGTFGYLDPEYYRRRKLTEKSDVYSFGVVLFEVLCARPAVNPMAVEGESEKVGLAEWVLHCHDSGTIERMVDPNLEVKIESECLKAFVDVGIKCLADKTIDRPTMGEVLGNLEKILCLQESLDERENQLVHVIEVN